MLVRLKCLHQRKKLRWPLFLLFFALSLGVFTFLPTPKHIRISLPKIKFVEGRSPHIMLYLGWQRGGFSMVVLRFWNFGYDFWEIGGDVLRWLCRHTHFITFLTLQIETIVKSPKQGVMFRWLHVCLSVCMFVYICMCVSWLNVFFENLVCKYIMLYLE